MIAAPSARTRRRLRAFPLAGLAFLAAAGGAFADEGRIPIYQPTTISQPGSYILTADISVPSGTALTIAGRRVALDLNGHSVSVAANSSGNYAIFLAAAADDVWIFNGRVLGGYYGLRRDPTTNNDLSLHLERLTFQGQGFRGASIAPVRHFEASRCQVIGGGIVPGGQVGIAAGDPGFPAVSARLEQSSFSGWDIGSQLIGDRGLQVRNNSFASNGRGPSASPATAGGGGILVEGNVVVGATRDGISGSGGIVRNNVVREVQLQGIFGGHLIAENLITLALQGAGGGAIFVNDSRALVERNVVQSTGGVGCGIAFYSSSSVDGAYRDNLLRNNPGGAVCLLDGATATDAGGNIQ